MTLLTFLTLFNSVVNLKHFCINKLLPNLDIFNKSIQKSNMKVSLNKLFYDICYFSFKPIVYSFVAAIGMFTVYKLKDRKGLKYFKSEYFIIIIPRTVSV